ncbi:hypothetical protein [Flavihumibacter fluvii]|uniref:hypothetical protein n=1 Tax=Flavihumibacter fluvii TaxID=2838157 RepID=UPI001BDE9F15|nr:hypothetical protein [Flavihumibacter fluvii]ULQ52065.1 hypothetical protein KJS93_18390 [Flavihumibacter fluvii]
MKNGRLYFWALLGILCLQACTSASKRKSADYYEQNKTLIHETLQLYDQLYRHQPFSAGFTDKSFKYYLLEVNTDTLRYIYNTDNNDQKFYQTILKFQYDTTKLKNLGTNIKAIKCLWLSKSSFYVDKRRETVTFLSFKSASTDKPFVENKYYILIFLPHQITSPDISERIKKGRLVKINDLVYFTIAPKFR